ncbi:MAG: type II secretion system F family protein [Planctomycetales bacterium]|nr:type II secretion system F family protein [Planctomycetales bacterium]
MKNTQPIAGPMSLLAKLQSIQIGGDPGGKIAKKDLIRIIRNLATLVCNGVSIPQALDTILDDAPYKKYRKILRALADNVRTGGALSGGMKKFPATFSSLLVHQVRVGEQAGMLQQTLSRIAEQLEHSSKIKSFIIKKITYPAILVVAGTGSVIFMLTCVIPTFQKMYEESGAVLPGITQAVINLSDFVQTNGISILVGIGILVAAIYFSYRNPVSRLWIDKSLLRIPLLGNWLRNLAVLQYIETLGNLLESGFNLVDALPAAANSVGNRYMRKRLMGLHNAIRQGQRFSTAMQKESRLFPPVVKQLVVIGERTGRLSEITREIRNHLRDDVQKNTTAVLGAIEPVLTASLAVLIGCILLAVYLPMFDMIGNTRK